MKQYPKQAIIFILIKIEWRLFFIQKKVTKGDYASRIFVDKIRKRDFVRRLSIDCNLEHNGLSKE